MAPTMIRPTRAMPPMTPPMMGPMGVDFFDVVPVELSAGALEAGLLGEVDGPVGWVEVLVSELEVDVLDVELEVDVGVVVVVVAWEVPKVVAPGQMISLRAGGEREESRKYRLRAWWRRWAAGRRHRLDRTRSSSLASYPICRRRRGRSCTSACFRCRHCAPVSMRLLRGILRARSFECFTDHARDCATPPTVIHKRKLLLHDGIAHFPPTEYVQMPNTSLIVCTANPSLFHVIVSPAASQSFAP